MTCRPIKQDCRGAERRSTHSHYHYCFIKAVYASWLSCHCGWSWWGAGGRVFRCNLGQRAARVEQSDRPLPDWIGKTHMFNRYPLKIIGLIIHNTEMKRFVNLGPQRLSSDTNIRGAFSEMESTCQADRLGPNCFKCEYMQMLCGEETRAPGGHRGEAGSQASPQTKSERRQAPQTRSRQVYRTAHFIVTNCALSKYAVKRAGNNQISRLYMVSWWKNTSGSFDRGSFNDFI